MIAVPYMPKRMRTIARPTFEIKVAIVTMVEERNMSSFKGQDARHAVLEKCNTCRVW
jgi:hypothetical protein